MQRLSIWFPLVASCLPLPYYFPFFFFIKYANPTGYSTPLKIYSIFSEENTVDYPVAFLGFKVYLHHMVVTNRDPRLQILWYYTCTLRTDTCKLVTFEPIYSSFNAFPVKDSVQERWNDLSENNLMRRQSNNFTDQVMHTVLVAHPYKHNVQYRYLIKNLLEQKEWNT